MGRAPRVPAAWGPRAGPLSRPPGPLPGTPGPRPERPGAASRARGRRRPRQVRRGRVLTCPGPGARSEVRPREAGGRGRAGTLGRHRAGTLGPGTGLAVLRRELLGEPVSDGRAAGLRAPRTDLSCRESSETRRRAAWPFALAFHLRRRRFPNGLTPARCPDGPVWGPGPQTATLGQCPPNGPTAWGRRGGRGRAARRGGAACGAPAVHPLGEREG